MTWEELVADVTSRYPLKESKMFGIPGLEPPGRVRAGFTQGAILLELTDAAHVRALAIPGAHLFDPSGHGEHFRQRVVVPAAHTEERESLSYEAVDYDHTVTRSG